MQLSPGTKSRSAKRSTVKPAKSHKPESKRARKASSPAGNANPSKSDAAASNRSVSAKAKPGSHAQYPDALVRFMLTNWADRKLAVIALDRAEAHRQRRSEIGKAFPNDVIIVPTGHERTRANDTVYRFRPGSDFFYLTGNLEPDCVLVLVPLSKPRRGDNSTHDEFLFVEPNPGRSDKTFFTDHSKGELWVGPRLGVAESEVRFGISHCSALEELPRFVKGLAKRFRGRVRVLRGLSDGTERLVGRLHPRDGELAQRLSEIRLIKDKQEIVELTKVVEATKRGFEDVIRVLGRARSEREVEGTFNLRARVEGNDTGYNTIAASGANACILHWTRNDAQLNPTELLLLDAGIEGHALYTADITRTLPISGKFSAAQAEVYDLVERAQSAALQAVAPGNDFMEPNRRAQRVLAEGLEAMGILKDAEFALRPEQQLHRRYTLHNTSHMLGLDVHDCAKARQEVYRYGKLKPGMVLTIEPGLYFQPDDLTVPERYRGIGVRIEDDVLVTETGMENLSGAIPRTRIEVERWMKRIQAE